MNFYPRPPRGGRRLRVCRRRRDRTFLSTPSARRATTRVYFIAQRPANFYPRPPRGGRRVVFQRGRKRIRISIHALREEGDFFDRVYPQEHGISIHALREEGDADVCYCRNHLVISIHALREEGDGTQSFQVEISRHFYPRPPRGGRRDEAYTDRLMKLFLSTPSARRATAKTETKSLFSNKLYNILHEFRRALIYNGSKSYPNHAK